MTAAITPNTVALVGSAPPYPHGLVDPIAELSEVARERGVEEADFDRGRVVLRFAAQPAFKNYHGHVQGGFAVAMIDVVMSIAAYAKTRVWLPTVEIKSTFVAPLMLGESRGEASVIKAGRQLVFLEAKLWGPDGNLAVHATATASFPRRGTA